MRSIRMSRGVRAAVALIFLVAAASTKAETIYFTGTLGVIEIDSGTSKYSNVNVGDSFSGSLTYGNSASAATSIDTYFPYYSHYAFTGIPYGGTITTGAITTTGTDSTVLIGNDDGMGDDADFLNNLYGAGSTTTETIADTWGVDAVNAGFGVSLYSLDTTLFSGLAIQRFPGALDNFDFTLFYVADADTAGNLTYLATGKLTSITVAPIQTKFLYGIFTLLGEDTP